MISVCKYIYFLFQTFDFDLAGKPLASNDELLVLVKDWELVGRNR